MVDQTQCSKLQNKEYKFGYERGKLRSKRGRFILKLIKQRAIGHAREGITCCTITDWPIQRFEGKNRQWCADEESNQKDEVCQSDIPLQTDDRKNDSTRITITEQKFQFPLKEYGLSEVGNGLK